ncbi:hypothetical protein OIV83_005809 [Microbotryomycetes sp. JL201]|nr:hypothetical protein OIV83_005809 [Microbotryomycetes sp. JL201]
MFPLARVATALLVASTAVSALNPGNASAPIDILGLATLNPNILSAGNSLINVNVLADVLSPDKCTGTAAVGLHSRIQVLNLLKVCACVEVANQPSGDAPCPPCPANASPICAQGQCGCECDIGYYGAVVDGKEVCVPGNQCEAPNRLIALTNGKAKASIFAIDWIQRHKELIRFIF